jgi:uncharacterized protein YbjQ (UPF0145 family)
MASTCSRCGQRQNVLSVINNILNPNEYVCPSCQASERKRQEAEEERKKRLRKLATKVVVTTTHGLDGFRVVRYLGIESVEFVIGTGLFAETATAVQDIFGARSTAFEQKLQEAKTHAMTTLKIRAAEKGGNAVIGVDLDYAEFTGNRIALVINGTIVVVMPVESTGQD